LKTDGTYKVNNVLQVSTPMPDSNTIMVLDDTTCIGYPDVVDRTNCVFKVYTEEITDAEDTAEYDAWVICNNAAHLNLPTPNEWADENTEVWVDENTNHWTIT